MSITTEQARALRNATSLCFDYNGPHGSGIRAIVRENGDYSTERTTYIEASGSLLDNFGADTGPFVGFHMEMNVRVSDAMQSIIRDLRTGSMFVLRWVRDNSSEVLRENGLVCDELRITIQQAGSKTARTYRVYKQIGYDNTARMIRVDSNGGW